MFDVSLFHSQGGSGTGPANGGWPIGAAAMVVSHANDSVFWVVPRMSHMNVKKGHKLHTAGTLILGTTAGAALYVLILILISTGWMMKASRSAEWPGRCNKSGSGTLRT